MHTKTGSANVNTIWWNDMHFLNCHHCVVRNFYHFHSNIIISTNHIIKKKQNLIHKCFFFFLQFCLQISIQTQNSSYKRNGKKYSFSIRMQNKIDKQLKMISLHTMIIGVVLLATLLSTAQSSNPDAKSTENTRIIQFRDANFSIWNEKIKYNSTAMSNPKGMEPLYNITSMILDFFLGKKPIPDGEWTTHDFD